MEFLFSFRKTDKGGDPVPKKWVHKPNVFFLFKAEVSTMGMKRKDSELVHGSEEYKSFGGQQVTFKMKTCGLAAKKECLAKKEKQHLAERKEVRRGVKEITKILGKPVWSECRWKRP